MKHLGLSGRAEVIAVEVLWLIFFRVMLFLIVRATTPLTENIVADI